MDWDRNPWELSAMVGEVVREQVLQERSDRRGHRADNTAKDNTAKDIQSELRAGRCRRGSFREGWSRPHLLRAIVSSSVSLMYSSYHTQSCFGSHTKRR